MDQDPISINVKHTASSFKPCNLAG